MDWMAYFKRKGTGTNSYRASKACRIIITRERYIRTNGWKHVGRVSNFMKMSRYPFFVFCGNHATKISLDILFFTPYNWSYISFCFPYIVRRKTLMETVGLERNPQRAGEGGNLVTVAGYEYHSGVSGWTLCSKSGRSFCVKEKHMLVCGNRWYNEE